MPIAGTVSDLYVTLRPAPRDSTVPAGYTFEILKNNLPTSVKCVVTGAATSCTPLDNSTAEFSAGDAISVRSIPFTARDPFDTKDVDPIAYGRVHWTVKLAPAP
jgi:hypothetical protein